MRGAAPTEAVVLVVGVMLALVFAGGMLPAIGQDAAAAPAAQQTAGFFAMDLLLDTKGRRLGAYQVEIFADPRPAQDGAEQARVMLVGVEGGTAAGFKSPPAYDPAALHGDVERVVLAAYTLQPAPASERLRVARLHLRNESGAPVSEADFRVRLMRAGEDEHTPIDVGAQLVFAERTEERSE